MSSTKNAIKLPKTLQISIGTLSAAVVGFSLGSDIVETVNSLSSSRIPIQMMDHEVFTPEEGDNHAAFAGIPSSSLSSSWGRDLLRAMVPRSAHADSTGKMSTKLTARKRYIPRIADGVKKFNALLKDQAVADEFFKGAGDKKPGVDNLIRAMNLFGASLRVGETPDKISREAEQITAAFRSEIAKAQSNPTKETLAPAAAKLREYIAFAEQHSVSPIDHYEVEL